MIFTYVFRNVVFNTFQYSYCYITRHAFILKNIFRKVHYSYNFIISIFLFCPFFCTTFCFFNYKSPNFSFD